MTPENQDERAASETTQVVLPVTHPEFKRLNELAALTGAKSRVDLIRRVLIAYDRLQLPGDVQSVFER